MKPIFYANLNDDIRQLRTAVFVEEQGFQNEFDEIDAQALHLVIYDDSQKAAAVGRLYEKTPGVYVIGRIAVEKGSRGLHLGNQVIALLEEKVKSLHGTKIILSAQCRVLPFYEKLGYRPSGAVYMDEFCPHILMEKNL